MTDYEAPLFQNTPETWDAAKCEKLAKRYARDGMGTKYPFKGYIGESYGNIRYNGGCIRTDDKGNRKWFQGETRPFPIVAAGFKIVPAGGSWCGYRIIKENEDAIQKPE